MAKPRYRITPEDQGAAERYLRQKIRQDYWPMEDASLELKAERALKRAQRDLVTLNTWCEQWLDAEQWTQLKNAIRAARKRAREAVGEKPVNVTLSRKAWRILSDLAQRKGVTLSALIEARLGKEWLRE